jgi:hypothetical protein
LPIDALQEHGRQQPEGRGGHDPQSQVLQEQEQWSHVEKHEAEEKQMQVQPLQEEALHGQPRGSVPLQSSG